MIQCMYHSVYMPVRACMCGCNIEYKCACSTIMLLKHHILTLWLGSSAVDAPQDTTKCENDLCSIQDSVPYPGLPYRALPGEQAQCCDHIHCIAAPLLLLFLLAIYQ